MAQTTTLWRYPVARSTDPEELLHGLSRTFRLSRITPLGPLPQGRTHELRGVRASEFTIGLVTSPLAVRIGAGSGSSFFVNMVLSGALHAERDEERIVNSPSLAAVFNAGDPHVLRPEPDGADVLGLRLDRDLVERELAGLLGHPTEGPLRFDFALDLTTAATTGLRVAVDAILEQLDSEHEVLHHPAYTLGQVRSFVTGLLLAHRHNYSEALLRGHAPPRPRTLRRALEFVDEHLADPITLGDIAVAAGCSARTVQDAFQQHLEVSPMTYVRQQRLDRVRAELLRTSAPVSEIACRWGFTHLGRFSGSYLERFGELPSTTRRA